jgi:hypothetical protein
VGHIGFFNIIVKGGSQAKINSTKVMMGADLFINVVWQFILNFALTEVGCPCVSMKKP